MSAAAAFRPLADSGLLVELEPRLDPAINALARAVASQLSAVPGVIETVSTLRAALIVFDPLVTDLATLLEAAEQAVQSPAAPSGEDTRLVEVPVVYGGAAGPDLEEAASLCGLSPEQVVRAHAGREYTVYMLGFTPGYPYLGVLHQDLALPRLATPRLRVPAGSVGIADALTGIYPMDSAGGWRLIGRTPLAIYDPSEADPVLLRPGDRVRFAPVAEAAFPAPRDTRMTPPPRPVFEIRSGGLHTTVQDLGRPGFRRLGIPAAGAMDPLALQVANLAVANDPGAPALEFTVPGPVVRMLRGAYVAVAGADLSPTLDGVTIEPAHALAVRAGQILAFGAPRRGVWCYLAVQGGIDVSPTLGSAATFAPGRLGGHGGRRLREGDILGMGAREGHVLGRGHGEGDAAGGSHRPTLRTEELDLPASGEEVTARVIPGPQDDWLTEDARAALLRDVFTLSVHSDRAGARLEGPLLAHSVSGEFLSDGLLPGAVQVPSGGRPIIILNDGPTTGGYPKAAAVISADLRMVAQCRPGTRLRFKAVSMEEAVDALRRQRERLRDVG